MGTAAILLLVVLSILLGLIIGLLLHRGPAPVEVDRGQQRAQAYLKGVEYLLSNDHDAAIAVLSNLARSDTESVETYFALGSLFRQKGEYARGIQIHQNLLARPNLDVESRVKASLALGRDLRRAGLLDQAAQTLYQLIALHPDQREALELLIDIHAQAGDIERALEVARQLRRIGAPVHNRRLASLHVIEARSHLGAERFDQAKSALRSAAELDPSSPEVPLGRAEIHRRQGQSGKELEALLEAVALHPALALDLAPRWSALAAEGLPVLERLTMLADERDHDPFVATARARLLLDQGRGPEAEQVLRAVIGSEPRLTTARRLLGEILLADRDASQRREVEELLSASGAPLFACRACGHRPPTFTWQCPACHDVGTLAILAAEEGR